MYVHMYVCMNVIKQVSMSITSDERNDQVNMLTRITDF